MINDTEVTGGLYFAYGSNMDEGQQYVNISN